ncbi:hypothetical protein SUGI_0586880 [Cryptomeria japonica]|nr:hypothetical protein SUGI_0586880 [Cryptomeria japonica]
MIILLSPISVVNGRSPPLDTAHLLDKGRNEVHQPMDEKTELYQGTKRHELVELKSQIGSKPPRCQSKCNSCKPCEAVQVPAVPQSRKISRDPNTPAAGTQEYSNYKPMSWKCKCGDKLFNP